MEWVNYAPPSIPSSCPLLPLLSFVKYLIPNHIPSSLKYSLFSVPFVFFVVKPILLCALAPWRDTFVTSHFLAHPAAPRPVGYTLHTIFISSALLPRPHIPFYRPLVIPAQAGIQVSIFLIRAIGEIRGYFETVA